MQLFSFVPVAQVVDGRRFAVRPLLADRIGTAVDLPLEALGLLARRQRRPIGEGADRDAALQPVRLAAIVAGSPFTSRSVNRSAIGEIRVGTVSALETDFTVLQCRNLSEGVKQLDHIS
jgi:hypothetical protein